MLALSGPEVKTRTKQQEMTRKILRADLAIGYIVSQLEWDSSW